MEHPDRGGALDARRPQKRSLCDSVQQPVRTTQCTSLAFTNLFTDSATAAVHRFGDKVVTGSFDKTAKIWDSSTGELLHTLRGHSTEIVCLSFDPTGQLVATGSMDSTAKLWCARRLCSRACKLSAVTTDAHAYQVR
jgi:WD40 repeat protein